jgi:hypothetical protein
MKYRSLFLSPFFTRFYAAFLSLLTLTLMLTLIPKYAISAQVSIAWDPNSKENIDHYTVHYGTTSRDYDFDVDIGKSTNCTISGLDLNETYFFSVTASDDAGNESAYSNEVSTSIGPVKLISPNVGEIIPSGSVYTLEWEAVPEVEYFKLEYSLNEGKEWIKIKKGIVGTIYDWGVPTLTKNEKNCLVKVVAYDADDNKIARSKSDSPFTIAVATITSPNRGEILTSGDTHNIEWDTYETKKQIAMVVLQYTKNGGEKWKSIKTIKGDNPGAYSWTVPDVSKTKTKCKVKVQLKDINGKSLGADKSGGYFTIEP